MRTFTQRLLGYAFRKADSAANLIRSSLKNREKNYVRQQYVQGGMVPWTNGYIEHRHDTVGQLLHDAEKVKAFAAPLQSPLPLGYGFGLDERCIEWPWAMANLQPMDKTVLDAGSALNHEHILDLPAWQDKGLSIITLAPERICQWWRGISYTFADLRHLPYRDDWFDVAVSISTLEHVGMDNKSFSNKECHNEHATQDVFSALSELRRVIRPGGRLLFTVPFGKYEDHGIFQQFDASLLEQAASHFKPSCREDTFFRYSAQGWQTARMEECASEAFAINAFKGVAEPDLAAAARAVACCIWWK